jgi:hypothetical protein
MAASQWTVILFVLFTTVLGWTQQGSKLLPVNALAYNGYSVSLTDAGDFMAVSGPELNGARGAVWVYGNNKNGTWTLLTGQLYGNGAEGPFSYQGWSIDFSSDGATLASGGYYDDHTAGAVWIFVKDPTKTNSWIQQGDKLVGTGASGKESQQGTSVSLSADGNTLISGAPNDNNGTGAVWVFFRTGSTWAQQGAKLVGTGMADAQTSFGTAVAVSGTGDIFAAGAPADGGSVGAVWIFTRTNGVWTQQGDKLVGTEYSAPSMQGSAVALNGAGDTLLVGGHWDSQYAGAAWVFVRSGSMWAQQGPKLAVGTSNSFFGASVALTKDGNLAAIGANGDSKFLGATYVYLRSSGTWSQDVKQPEVGTGNTGAAEQGWSVALTSDGSLLAVGGYHDNDYIGAVWVFNK